MRVSISLIKIRISIEWQWVDGPFPTNEKVAFCVSCHRKTSSARSITDAVLGVYDAKVNPKLSIRRLTITANRLVGEDTAQQEPEAPVQFNLFDNIEVQEQRLQEESAQLERERKIQEAMLGIKKKFGKNAILNGGSYLEGATAKERNKQIGGHKA